MDHRSALELLGLSGSPSRDEIDLAFRKRIMAAHPEVSDTDGDESARQLIDARDTLIADERTSQTGVGTDLVPINTALVLAREIRKELDRESANDSSQASTALLEARAEKVVSRVVMHQIGRLQRIRRNRNSVAFLLGALAVISLVLRVTLSLENAPYNSSLRLESALFSTAVVCGIFSVIVGWTAWLLRGLEELQGQRLQEATESLSDPATFYDVLHEIANEPMRDWSQPDGPLDLDHWTRAELTSCIRLWIARTDEDLESTRRLFSLRGSRIGDWFSSELDEEPLSALASRIGAPDFASVAIARGLEHGYLASNYEVTDGSSRAKLGYRLLLGRHQVNKKAPDFADSEESER